MGVPVSGQVGEGVECGQSLGVFRSGNKHMILV